MLRWVTQNQRRIDRDGRASLRRERAQIREAVEQRTSLFREDKCVPEEEADARGQRTHVDRPKYVRVCLATARVDPAVEVTPGAIERTWRLTLALIPREYHGRIDHPEIMVGAVLSAGRDLR